MAALWRATGQRHTKDSLIHAVSLQIYLYPSWRLSSTVCLQHVHLPHNYLCLSVCLKVLYLEQLLTTGGGWQDQCGGMYGGAKISKSGIGLPVKISTQEIGMLQKTFVVYRVVL